MVKLGESAYASSIDETIIYKAPNGRARLDVWLDQENVFDHQPPTPTTTHVMLQATPTCHIPAVKDANLMEKTT